MLTARDDEADRHERRDGGFETFFDELGALLAAGGVRLLGS